jgi:hypothetical protein
MPVQRKQDFISNDCKQLLITLEGFTINLKEFQQHAKDLELDNARLRDIVSKLDRAATMPHGKNRMSAMWQLLKERHDTLHLPIG